jgi:hypothetical protein
MPYSSGAEKRVVDYWILRQEVERFDRERRKLRRKTGMTAWQPL